MMLVGSRIVSVSPRRSKAQPAMNLEWLLLRLMTSAIIVSIGTFYSAIFVKLSLALTAKMLGTAAPRPGTARTLVAGFCLTLVDHLLYQMSDLAGTGGLASHVNIVGVVSVPTYRFVALPLQYFLLAGLMIRFLPTTLARGCLVSLNFQLLTTAVLVLLVIVANLSRLFT